MGASRSLFVSVRWSWECLAQNVNNLLDNAIALNRQVRQDLRRDK